MYYTPVAGTWGWSETKDEEYDWWEFGSEFNKFATKRNTLMSRPADPFVWSTNLDGLSRFAWLRKLITHKQGNYNWDAAGWAFNNYQSGVTYWHRSTILHSHGLQVISYACGKYNLELPVLVTFASPIRSDLKDLYKKARKNIRYWIHIYDPEFDFMQWAGGLFDSDCGNSRECSYADINIPIPTSSHSNLLKNPNYFHLLDEHKVFELMRHGFK